MNDNRTRREDVMREGAARGGSTADTAGGRDAGDDLGPAELLALAEHQRARTSAALEIDGRLLFGAWGLAWLLGFGLFWLTTPYREGAPPLAVPMGVAGAVFAGLLLAAAVVTTAHIMRRSRGVRGPSSRQGAMYGWAWMLGFVAVTCMNSGVLQIVGDDLATEVAALLWPAASGLVVGLLYCAGGALWDDPLQFGLGAWLLATTSLGVLGGVTALYLTMALAGGGGFLVAAALLAARQARS